MRGSGRWTGAVLAALLALTICVEASAHCRTYTCDPYSDGPDGCELVDGCLVGGLPLYWAARCVSFSVQEDGSPLRGISYEQALHTITNAFKKWTTVDCGGQPPSLQLTPTEPVHCARHEYNKDHPNANIWMFRDDDWPYSGGGAGTMDGTLALTTITFNVETAEIYDADVEINSHGQAIALVSDRWSSDLASIVAHEAGHALGLSHSTDPRATMYASYAPGSTSLRTLSRDDAAGICEAYPLDRETTEECHPEPRHGFSTECEPDEEGCQCTAPGRRLSEKAWTWRLFLLGFLAAALRRRKRGRGR